MVRVLILEDVPTIGVSLRDTAMLHMEGKAPVPIARGTALLFSPDATGVVARESLSGEVIASAPVIHLIPETTTGVYTAGSVADATGQWWESPGHHPYEGKFEIRSGYTTGVLGIVVLPVEEYLRGVVPFEIGVTAPLEAMKAQAVAARAEIITALSERTYAGTHHDICADVNCQVFRGIGRRTEETDRAVRETRGIVITHNGATIPAYYSSNAGGHTEDIREVWPHRDRGIPVWDGVFDGAPEDAPADLRVEANAREWLLSRPHVYTNPELHPGIPGYTKTNFRWERTVTAEDLSAWIAERKDIGLVTAIVPLRRGPSGRLSQVRFVGEKGEYEIGPELAIRRLFRPALRSSAIVIDAGENGEFLLHGAGHGHGVGMCQTGAMARALQGQNHAQILTHYYRDTELTRLYE